MRGAGFIFLQTAFSLESTDSTGAQHLEEHSSPSNAFLRKSF